MRSLQSQVPDYFRKIMIYLLTFSFLHLTLISLSLEFFRGEPFPENCLAVIFLHSNFPRSILESFMLCFSTCFQVALFIKEICRFLVIWTSL